MIYKAKDIADYILNYYGIRGTEINNYKLQEVLYYMQANYLVTCGTPLFEEPIIAKKFGPAVEPVYSKYRGYGGSTIPYKWIKGIKKYTEIIDEKDKKIINLMLNLLEPYLYVPFSDLDGLTKLQAPWMEAYRLSQKDSNPESVYIKNENLLWCFSEDNNEKFLPPEENENIETDDYI